MFKLTLLFILPATMFLTSGKERLNKNLQGKNLTISQQSLTSVSTLLPKQGDNVNGILQQNNGTLWFSTSGSGVYRYDGKSFTNFTIKDGMKNNSVFSMLQDKKGNIWFGTFSGLSRFDGKAFIDIPDADFSLVYSLLEDKTGKLWISTNKGIYWYDGIAFTRFLDNQNVINKNGLELVRVDRMIEDKQRNIWFATCTEGVCRYDGKSIVNYKPNNEEYFRGLLEDRNGNIWVGGRTTGVSRFDGNSFTSILQNGSFDSCIAYSIIQDKTGNIWFGTEPIDDSKRKTEGGIWVYDGTSFKNFLKKDGLSNNAVWSVLEDRTGNIWVGTRAGLCRFDGKNFTSFSE